MDGSWTVILVEEVREWYLGLEADDPKTQDLVEAAINLLEAKGPKLHRPMVDTISASRIPNLKELRPGSTGRSEMRILFVFDPTRQAILLVAGNKAGDWNRWYTKHIPEAERRYQRWLDGGYGLEED